MNFGESHFYKFKLKRNDRDYFQNQIHNPYKALNTNAQELSAVMSILY